MSAEGPATVTLTDDDLAAIRADTVSHASREHPYCRSCVRNVLALLDRVAALTADLATARADFTASTEATMRALDERDEARQVIANVRAVLPYGPRPHVDLHSIGRWDMAAVVAALLPAAPTGEGS